MKQPVEFATTDFSGHPDYSCDRYKMKPFGKSFFAEAANFVAPIWEKVASLTVEPRPSRTMARLDSS